MGRWWSNETRALAPLRRIEPASVTPSTVPMSDLATTALHAEPFAEARHRPSRGSDGSWLDPAERARGTSFVLHIDPIAPTSARLSRSSRRYRIRSVVGSYIHLPFSLVSRIRKKFVEDWPKALTASRMKKSLFCTLLCFTVCGHRRRYLRACHRSAQRRDFRRDRLADCRTAISPDSDHGSDGTCLLPRWRRGNTLFEAKRVGFDASAPRSIDLKSADTLRSLCRWAWRKCAAMLS